MLKSLLMPRNACLSELVESHLSHSTTTAAVGGLLPIRCARGFALIGLAYLFLGGVVVARLGSEPRLQL